MIGISVAGSLAKGELGAVHDESLLWLQAQAWLLQLHAASWMSCTALAKIASEIELSVSKVESLVQEMTAVPKPTVLPIFHRIGQLFEVQWPNTQLLLVGSFADFSSVQTFLIPVYVAVKQRSNWICRQPWTSIGRQQCIRCCLRRL